MRPVKKFKKSKQTVTLASTANGRIFGIFSSLPALASLSRVMAAINFTYVIVYVFAGNRRKLSKIDEHFVIFHQD